MKIENTNIEEVKVIIPKVFEDFRGYFFESFKSNEYLSRGLPAEFVQDNEVRSKKNVLRGFHYQLDKPQGVKGRSSNNDLIKKELGWDYKYSLKDGIKKTYEWIEQIYINKKNDEYVRFTKKNLNN